MVRCMKQKSQSIQGVSQCKKEKSQPKPHILLVKEKCSHLALSFFKEYALFLCWSISLTPFQLSPPNWEENWRKRGRPSLLSQQDSPGRVCAVLPATSVGCLFPTSVPAVHGSSVFVVMWELSGVRKGVAEVANVHRYSQHSSNKLILFLHSGVTLCLSVSACPWD